MAQKTFNLIQTQSIKDLKVDFYEFEHIATGAKHFHLASEDTENVFLVALRTNPTDSTGIAHILEHTSLCGSENYPVRDPFFLMLRRSLSTFMNAFTSSDWTAYPFATQNPKDFYNLLSVYLDAVFFSKLDRLDFAQEGHRLALSDPKNPDSDLIFKGVVFNEMKGAMSSTNSILYDLMGRYLFPTNTYHHNSGGDPAHIPDLTYEQLIRFYKKHYHPSNAAIFTYGNLPCDDIQERIDSLALSKFKKDPQQISVTDEKRYFAPIKIEDSYGLAEEQTGSKSFLLLGWLLGSNANPMERLEAQLVSDALLDNSASPLRKALEDFPYAAAPSSLCGLEDSQKEMCFLCGVEGSDPQHETAFTQRVLEVLSEVVEQGIPLEKLEAICHQIEFSQREITGDHYPYGLQLILSALPAAIHRNDPVKLLDVSLHLTQLRTNIQNPNYIKDLINKLLINNPHRVHLIVKPDNQLEIRKQEAEQAKLTAIKSQLTSADIAEIIQLNEALEARQNETIDSDVLPKVTLDDVNKTLTIPSATTHLEAQHSPIHSPITYFHTNTNTIQYIQAILPTPDLSLEEVNVLPLFTDIMTEIGSGDRTYLETQSLQSAVTGGFYASVGINPKINQDSIADYKSFFSLKAKCLPHHTASTLKLMSETLTSLKFNETQRIKDLIAQKRAAKERRLVGSGHTYAMLAAASPLHPLLSYQHQLSGLSGFQHLKALDDQLKSSDTLNDLPQHFESIFTKLQQQPLSLLCISSNDLETMLPHIKTHLAQSNPHSGTASTFALPTPLTGTPSSQSSHSVWFTNTAVSFCAQAVKTVAPTHPDSAVLTVLASYLRNNYLHRTIREQGGAYGGGATHDSTHGVFKFYSYRDPRITGTFQDFADSIAFIRSETPNADYLEEAILSVISNIDKPSSPAGEAIKAHYDQLYLRMPEFRQTYRQRILSVTATDLQNVAERYLTQPATKAVLTSETLWSKTDSSDLIDTADFQCFTL